MNTSSTTDVELRMHTGTSVSSPGVIPAAGTATTYGAFVDSALGTLQQSVVAISDGQTITALTSPAGTTADYLIVCMTFVVP